jgi:hypothetical protein
MIYQSPIGIESYQTIIVFCLHHNVLSPHGRKQATWTLWKQVQCGYYGIAIEALDPIHHLKNVVSRVLTNFTRGCCFNYKFYPLHTWGNPMKPKVRMKKLWMTSLDTLRIGSNLFLKKMIMLVICICVHLPIKFNIHINGCLSCCLSKVHLVCVSLIIPCSLQVSSVLRIKIYMYIF